METLQRICIGVTAVIIASVIGMAFGWQLGLILAHSTPARLIFAGVALVIVGIFARLSSHIERGPCGDTGACGPPGPQGPTGKCECGTK